MQCILEQLVEPESSILVNQVGPDLQGPMRDYIHMLLAAFSQERVAWSMMTDCTDGDEPAANPALELLSEREIEIITLMARGFSKAEIAAQLFLSHNTIKAHTRNIYSKLGMHSRAEAMLRARELGLPV